MTIAPISYAVDSPAKGRVTVTYKSDQVVGVVLRSYPSYRTVVYVLGGVPFMDTLFLETGVVLSTEHKDLAGAQIATTWRMICKTSH